METAKELGTTELFQGLKPDDLAHFAGIASEKRFGPDEVVYDAGGAGDSLYVIVEGSFTVRVNDENDEEVDVATLKAGSYFGEMEVIGGFNRTASVVALSDARCYNFDAGGLLSLLKQNDTLAAHFYREICRGVIKRLKATTRDMGYFKSRAG